MVNANLGVSSKRKQFNILKENLSKEEANDKSFRRAHRCMRASARLNRRSSKIEEKNLEPKRSQADLSYNLAQYRFYG